MFGAVLNLPDKSSHAESTQCLPKVAAPPTAALFNQVNAEERIKAGLANPWPFTLLKLCRRKTEQKILDVDVGPPVQSQMLRLPGFSSWPSRLCPGIERGLKALTSDVERCQVMQNAANRVVELRSAIGTEIAILPNSMGRRTGNRSQSHRAHRCR